MTKLSGQTKTSQNCSSSFKLCRCPVFFPLRLHSILRPLPKAKYRAQGHFNFLSAEGLEAVITERECQKREWIAACLLWKFTPYVKHEGHFHPTYERNVIVMRLYIRNKVKYDPLNAGKPLIFVEFPDPRAFTVGQVKEVSVTEYPSCCFNPSTSPKQLIWSLQNFIRCWIVEQRASLRSEPERICFYGAKKFIKSKSWRILPPESICCLRVVSRTLTANSTAKQLVRRPITEWSCPTWVGLPA